MFGSFAKITQPDNRLWSRGTMLTEKCGDQSRYCASHTVGTQKPIKLRRYNIFSFVLRILTRGRMINRANANKTCVEFLSKSV